MTADAIPTLLVLHTGGTIGMREGPRGFAPAKGALLDTILATRQLHDPSRYVESHGTRPIFTTLPFATGQRVRYEVMEYEPLLDSANLDLSHWVRFAEDVGANHDAYDGFVILHGTDTMAFTASALSFMLEGLAKPVILTGSQIPLERLRNDGLDNFLGALGLAALYPIPEVTLYFHHKLLRGNRASKHDASHLDAFDSPNLPPLVRVGIEVEVDEALALPRDERPFRVRTELSPHVASLRVYPGITAEVLANFLRPPLEGLVLETYGGGNFPERSDLLDVLREAVARGVLVLNVTQCPRGEVRADYQVGRALADVGVIVGRDLTAEAAMAKLAVILGQRTAAGWSHAEQVARVRAPIRGEMSGP
ncbi:MAG: asparaginase [Deltaproteobacteria bacterium]|nr:asparaginase [Deltaproteobacteria bacterium]